MADSSQKPSTSLPEIRDNKKVSPSGVNDIEKQIRKNQNKFMAKDSIDQVLFAAGYHGRGTDRNTRSQNIGRRTQMKPFEGR